MGFEMIQQAVEGTDLGDFDLGLDAEALAAADYTYIITEYEPETYSYEWKHATNSRLDEFSGRTNSAVVIAKTSSPTQISSLVGSGAKTYTFYPIGDPFVNISIPALALDMSDVGDDPFTRPGKWEVVYENSERTALLSKFGVPENPILTNAQILALTLNSVFANMAQALLNTQIESSQTFKRVDQRTLTSEQITPATLSAQEASARYMSVAGVDPASADVGSVESVEPPGEY